MTMLYSGEAYDVTDDFCDEVFTQMCWHFSDDDDWGDRVYREYESREQTISLVWEDATAEIMEIIQEAADLHNITITWNK